MTQSSSALAHGPSDPPTDAIHNRRTVDHKLGLELELAHGHLLGPPGALSAGVSDTKMLHQDAWEAHARAMVAALVP